MKKVTVNNLSLEQKYKAIQMKEAGSTVADIAAHFKCGKSQIYHAIQNKTNLQQRYLKSRESEKLFKKKQVIKYDKIGEHVYEWFCAARNKNFPISGPILKEKAIQIAQKSIPPLTEFKASTGWLDSFKHRYNITFQQISGEAKDVDPESVSSWHTKLKHIINDYDVSNIANMDETALFYRALPDKTLSLKGEKCFGGKKAKDRLTIALVVFMDGTIKKPIIIGNATKPRAFKNIDLKTFPIKYYANRKAWMTSSIFEEILRDLNNEMIKADRQILLFLDNATCHPRNDYSNVKLIFFPPNTTATLQPLDAGIIANFKFHYRKLMLQKLLAVMDTTTKASELSKRLNILDTIYFIKDSVGNIKSDTITKCFRKCGFSWTSATHISDTNDEDTTHTTELQNMIGSIYGDHLNSALDYLAIDQEALSENDQILTEILSNVASTPNQAEACSSDSDSDSINEISTNIPTRCVVIQHLEEVQRYALNENDPKLLNLALEAKLLVISKPTISKLKQSTLNDFFNKN